MKTIVLIIGILIFSSFATAQNNANNWYRGNTHTHTNFSDGDTPLSNVVAFYNDQGYNFLFITDHNLTSYGSVYETQKLRSDFILIPGNEITGKVHFTALNISLPLSYKEIIKEDIKHNSEIIQLVSRAITSSGGIAVVNHPNFSTGVQPQDIYGDNEITHIELFNGHPACANWGKPGHASMDSKWDSILSQGKLVYGIASDDAHNFNITDRKKANPGRGWIMVNAKSLQIPDIMEAIAEGKFYSSNGVFLKKCIIHNGKLKVQVDRVLSQKEIEKGLAYENIDTTGVDGFTIDVIGENGKILKSRNNISLSYKMTKKDKYARIRVTYCVSKGTVFRKYYAWTQPCMTSIQYK
ncbi:MAG: CehA/McbA family metallohydrolase [Bacteroidales bacterium]|jgi:hypothetical protein